MPTSTLEGVDGLPGVATGSVGSSGSAGCSGDAVGTGCAVNATLTALQCPSCGSPHVAQMLGDNGGITFVCTACGHSWS